MKLIRDYANEWRTEIMRQCEDIADHKTTTSVINLATNLKNFQETSKVSFDFADKIV